MKVRLFLAHTDHFQVELDWDGCWYTCHPCLHSERLVAKATTKFGEAVRASVRVHHHEQHCLENMQPCYNNIGTPVTGVLFMTQRVGGKVTHENICMLNNLHLGV